LKVSEVLDYEVSVRFCAIALLALAACGNDPAVIVPEVMSVVGVFPTAGAADVPTNVQPYVYFSHPIADPSAAASLITIECVGAPPCLTPDASKCSGSPAVQTTIAADRFSARVVPSSALNPSTCFAIVIGAGIVADAANVGALPTTLRSPFQTQ
jgi:hypothetical protein